MKQLFLTLTIVGLVSCNITETPTVTPKECCNDTTDTVDQVNTHPVDSNGVRQFDFDSTATVTDLLDSLTNYEPAAKMTH
jgi:hypothetical protein